MKLEPFRKKLEEEKARLEGEMQGVGRKNPAVPGDWEALPAEGGAEADIADQADMLVSREGNAAILADLEARYDTVLAALKRIAEDTYGKCEVCGKPIEAARLHADPAAQTCKAHL